MKATRAFQLFIICELLGLTSLIFGTLAAEVNSNLLNIFRLFTALLCLGGVAILLYGVGNKR